MPPSEVIDNFALPPSQQLFLPSHKSVQTRCTAMRFPRLKSPVSMTESLIDIDMMDNNSSTPGEADLQSSKTDNIWDNLVVPHTELINSDNSDLNDQTSSPLTAKNLEILSNSTHSSTIKHGSVSSKTTTVRSGSVEEVFKQVEDQDRQELPAIDNSTTTTTIANILNNNNPGLFQLLNIRNISLVGDLVGRLIHFDQREPILQRYQYFDPHPVAGTNGLLSWLTSQEKMAEEIIKSESREFFHWGWNPAIFSRAVRLGVRAPFIVPYEISTEAGTWFKGFNKVNRDTLAWDVLYQTIFPKSGMKQNSYEFRALANDFYSGKEVQLAEYYAHLTEPDIPSVEKAAASKLFHITAIDMGESRQNLHRNLYGGAEGIESAKLKPIVDLFLIELIQMNEIENALIRVEKDKRMEKSSFTVAKVQGTDVRRSSRYHECLHKLNTLERNKEEPGESAARSVLEDFVQNINIHGLDSIMGSESWSVTHIRTVPTLDEPSEEITVVEAVASGTPNNGGSSFSPRPTSPLLIPDISEPKTETASRKKKKKTKGKNNAKKVLKQESEPESAVAETKSQTSEIISQATPSIASDPLNYHFDDATNPLIEDDSDWKIVKPKPSKQKGPQATQQTRVAHSSKAHKDTSATAKVPPSCKVGRKKVDVPTKIPTQTTAATSKRGEKFEIESLKDFPEMVSPSKNDTQQILEATKKKSTIVMVQEVLPQVNSQIPAKGESEILPEEPLLPSSDLDTGAIIEADIYHGQSKVSIQPAAVILSPVPSREQANLSNEDSAEDVFKLAKIGASPDVEPTRTLIDEIKARTSINYGAMKEGSISTIGTEPKVEDTTTILSGKSSPRCQTPPARTLSRDAPIYLGNFDDPDQKVEKRFRSYSANATMTAGPFIFDDDEESPDPTVDLERPASVSEIMITKSIVNSSPRVSNSKIYPRVLPLAASLVSAVGKIRSVHDLCAVDNAPTIATSPLADSASVNNIVDNASEAAEPFISEACTGNEDAALSTETTSIPVCEPVAITSSTLTIHGPQPRSFRPSLMDLDTLHLSPTETATLGSQTTARQASVASCDTSGQKLSEFSNGWSRQQLSSSAIINSGPRTHTEPDTARIPFDCTYCRGHHHATIDSPMVLCHGCGPNGGIKYCSIACLLAESLAHANVCQESVDDSETFTISRPTAHQIYYTGILAAPLTFGTTFQKSIYAYRQKVFAMYCRSGPFPKIHKAWARQNNTLPTVPEQDAVEATKKTGSYFVFKSALTSNSNHMNLDSTVICTIKFRPNDRMLQAVDRCLESCFRLSHGHDYTVKEFLYRLIKDLLSDDESFDCFPHTEDRLTVFHEFQNQYDLEFDFDADMQSARSDKFDFESEWSLIEHLLSRSESEELV
ncbi:uncharacterized protein EAE98_003445 [Botrytis deweyae]|uniref:MYND-type zinc finger protein samB n=1 Tax=Botrytis deweyae TaxID=2478750 RepID=A0ABQ7ITL5_9HELO|nr:uncharacterized protein EAE98_003445 [Botrytis deweyae]KAF7933736.1 hypothetical protein EAE98_003445 [Botrytis deweyae]